MEAAIVEAVRQEPAARDFAPALFDDYVSWIDRGPRTARTYLCNLKQFYAWTLYQEVRNPRREDIIAYREWLSSEHDGIQLDPDAPGGWSYRRDAAGKTLKVACRATTVNGYLRSVGQFFQWTEEAGIYPNVADHVRPPKVIKTARKDALAPADVVAVEDSIAETAKRRQEAAALAVKDKAGKVQRTEEQGKRLTALYALAVNAGLRTIELSRADVKDFEEKGKKAYLWIHGKGHHEADVKKPLADEVAQCIRDYLQVRPDRMPGKDRPAGTAPLFVATGNRSGGQRLAPTTISTLLKGALQQAGYDSPRLTAHSLRHTTGTAVKAMTGNLYTTQRYMRHDSPVTTEIYIHDNRQEQEAQTARELYDYYHGKAAGAREHLETMIAGMDPAQIEKLAAIAAAIMD